MMDMIGRARRIVADGVWSSAAGDDDAFAWAEALLAEHDARVAAERKAEAEARECEEESARRERLAYRLVAAERERDRVRAIVEEMGDGVSPECSGFADKLRRALGDPERCPTCGSRHRGTVYLACAVDPWHHTTPLVEGEQG